MSATRDGEAVAEHARPWADSPYARIYYTIGERMGADYGDPAFVGSWTKLLLAADAAYPLPAPLPRWLDDTMLDRLVASGLIRRIGVEGYTVAGLARERADRDVGRAVGGRVRAATAQRNPDGTFASNEPSNEPTSASNDQLPTSNGEPASTSDPARDETSRDETSRDERGAMPGDSRSSKLARSRPGSRARRREIQDELQADHDVRRAMNGHDDRYETDRRAALAAIVSGQVDLDEAARFREFYRFTEAEIVGWDPTDTKGRAQ